MRNLSKFNCARTQPHYLVNFITSCEIELNVAAIKIHEKYYPPQKHIIHEIFHAIQYSFIDNNATGKDDFRWYDHEGYELIADAMSTWAEDNYYTGEALLASVYKSHKYFCEKIESNEISFPGNTILNADSGYQFGIFFNFLFKNLDKNAKDEAILKILTNLIKEEAVPGVVSYITSNGGNMTDTLHEFAMNNFWITKRTGIDKNESEYINAPKLWQIPDTNINWPVLTINDDQLPILKERKNLVLPYNTKFLKIKQNDYFSDSVTVCLTLSDSMSASVIAALGDAQKKYTDDSREVTYQELKYAEDKNFHYYIKKGLLPKYFVAVITNGTTDTKESEIKVIVDLPSPHPNTEITDILKLIENLSKGGNEFVNSCVSLYKTGIIKKMNALKIEIMNLYEKYKKMPKGPYSEHEFLARQLMQKILELNLLMHVSINQVHDMRYQYYLWKNLCINNIISPTPPPGAAITTTGNSKEISVLNQLTKLKIFMAEMTKLYNPNAEKTFMCAFHAFIIKSHAFVKISEIKNSFDWNDNENKISDEIEKMYKKFNSVVTGKSYPFWYSKDEIDESVNANPIVGMNEDEAYNPTVPPLPKTPAPVNYCPNPRTAILKAMNIKAGEEVFTVPKELLDIVIEVDGKSVKATDLIYLNADAKWKCDPLSLRYFSAFKKHEFQEANMPPAPTSANIGSYVSALSYYMKLGKNYSINNFDESIITKKEMIKACSDRIMETISAVTDAILKENKENTGQIYNLFKNAALQSEFKDEMLDMLEKQLRKDGSIMLNFDEK